MKKIIITTFVALYSILVFALQKVYHIKGEIPGSADGCKVYLYNNESWPAKIIDSTLTKNGTFLFKRNYALNFPMPCQLMIDKTPEVLEERKKEKKSFMFFVDNSDILIQCPIDSMPGQYYEERSKEHHVIITGSASQDLYNQYKSSVKELAGSASQLWKAYLKEYHVPAISGTFNTEKGMALAREQKRVKTEILEKQKQFIKDHPKSVVAIYLAAQIINSSRSNRTVAEIDALVNSIDVSLQGSPMMKGLRKDAADERSVAKGVKFADIMLTDLKGKSVNLASFVKPGQYNMLEFWASWCGPCRAEIPHLKHLSKASKNTGFNMISISIDEKDTDWKKALAEEKMEWTQLCDQKGRKGPVTEVYKVNGVPFCLILDKEGKIVCGGVRGAELDVVMTDIFGDKLLPL